MFQRLIHLRGRLLHALAGLATGAAMLFVLLASAPNAGAVISGSPCTGNVCTGTVTVGGQAVSYSYTQHLSANGQFRIRFNGGIYNTNGTVSYTLTGMQAFGTAAYTANPTNSAANMTESDVNPTRTAYEIRDSDGCTSCIFDGVMSVQYTGLAVGSYTFNFTIIQNGSTGGMAALPYYVDAGAPTNANEAVPWASLSGMNNPCADSIDNDIDFYNDCADSQCVGSVGQVVSGAVCQAAETSCNDTFDNDGDGKLNCLDPDCDGKVGQPSGTAKCQYQNEYLAANCGDGFDNDGDGYTDCVDNVATNGLATSACWKQAGYGCPATETSCNAASPDEDKDATYSAAWDNIATTGANCLDYDCAGNAACPNKENYTVGGVNDDALCFDGLDNDLDTKFDCADPDCGAAVNPNNSSQVCLVNEFDLNPASKHQYCANGFDDDGNGASDCADLSCKQQFGNCGPCPNREDYTWNACSDGKDNDSDAAFDCADTQCSGKIGSSTLGGICAATENTNQTCSDGFDNDGDAVVDCADPSCAGKTGPLGAVCQVSESSCGDGLDNDADGRIDCMDSTCAGVGSCGANSWTQATSCEIVPRYSGATAFTSDNPTVTATVRLATHVSDVDTIRLIGTGTYSSVTFVVGDNSVASSYYPYAAASPTCTLKDTSTGVTAVQFSFTAIASHAIQIYNKSGVSPAGFDLTLTCAVPSVPATIKYYPISLSALKTPSNYAEYGDVSFSTTLFEATPPTVSTVEGEGAIGAGSTITMPYSSVGAFARRFRGLPTDPAPSSGICGCDIDANGTSVAASSDCISAGVAFTADVASFPVRARAQDGAGNTGAYNAAKNFTVNVTPTITTQLSVSPSQPFFNTAEKTMAFSASFATGTSDSFPLPCKLYVYNDSNSLIGGPVGPTLASVGVLTSAANTATCSGSFDYTSISPSLSDGRYFAVLRATDNDGDYVDTNRRTFYVCNHVPTSSESITNGCEYADFDYDGTPEGLYTTKYSTSPKSCDNCVNLPNASQSDIDANGVGEMCEPLEEFGRCETDTDIVCKWDSDESPFCPGDDLCCPGPSVKDDPSTGAKKNPQKCELAWGLCTSDGSVCFQDPQCPGGKGKCQDGSTACYKDSECAALPGTALCTGADRCDNLLYPWIETKYGNVYTQKKITVADTPPKSTFNAMYCVTAKETITNFTSEGQGSCAAATDASARAELPKTANNFTTVKGKLDFAGLRNGKYGAVTTVSAAQLDSTISLLGGKMAGKVIRVVGDATIGAHVFYNDTKGAGTIFIDGGNLTITGDILYDTTGAANLKALASLGWFVIDDGTGTRGNVYVDKLVTGLVGAFYLNGSGGFYTVAPPSVESEVQLSVYGMVIAKEFHMGRSYKSITQGAERFVYDGRAVVNPPPGFTDITKALPSFSQ